MYIDIIGESHKKGTDPDIDIEVYDLILIEGKQHPQYFSLESPMSQLKNRLMENVSYGPEIILADIRAPGCMLYNMMLFFNIYRYSLGLEAIYPIPPNTCLANFVKFPIYVNKLIKRIFLNDKPMKKYTILHEAVHSLPRDHIRMLYEFVIKEYIHPAENMLSEIDTVEVLNMYTMR